jgi:ApaG protein
MAPNQDTAHQNITISIETQYEGQQSAPDEQRHVFSYNILIKNNGPQDIQLLRRHWIITDGNGQVREVAGEGVIGEQPEILVNSEFAYTSGAILETEVGSMQGYYTMCFPCGETFNVNIPIFTLAKPRALH